MKLIGIGFLWLTCMGALAQSLPGPQLVTPQIPPAIQGQPYAASLLIVAARPLTSAAITGLPTGLIAAHNGSGSIAISGSPTSSGTFALNVKASDTPPGALGVSLLNTSVNLTVYQVAGNVATVSAGGNHSCAMVNGGVQCWGKNDIGQLGNNSTMQSLVPVPTIPAGSNVTSLSAGDDHACAVVNGGVRCWGTTGMVSFFESPGVLVRPHNLVPTLIIAPGNGVTSVSAGGFHSCALVNGGVQCWGGNGTGQLGNNSTTPSPVPVETIAAGSGVTAISAGQLHSCAVVSGGVRCWGNTQSLVPVQTISAGSGVTAVSVGGDHSCAVVNGGVQCWGDNRSGQLGNNSIVRSVLPVEAIAPGSNVTAVSAGSAHSCAVVNGGVQCWGNNDYDQINTKSYTPSLVPVQVIAAGNNVSVVSAGFGFSGSFGGGHSCAVVNGSVQCWGSNANGQLGNGSTASSPAPVQAIAAGSNVTSVSAGSAHSCAVRNGGVLCWGHNFYGQLGNNSTAQSLVPAQAIAAGSNVMSVSAGRAHSCAVLNGGVQCWGFNFYGQLGNNSTAQSMVPTQVIAAGSNTTSVAVGFRHSCAAVNGGVQCWGGNNAGQLGNNGTTQSLVPAQAIAVGSAVTAVSAGEEHSCALMNGGVQCWGNNANGQIGNNSTTQSLVPVQAIAAGSGATAVSAGYFHSCAVVNGGVKCWGYNNDGQLGYYAARTLVPAETIAAGSNVTAVSAGLRHSCALIGGSSAQCWGGNLHGQIGNNRTSDNSSLPETNFNLRYVNAISAGALHSCGVFNGGVVCWGLNNSGQLGDTYIGDARRPVAALVQASAPSSLPITLSSNANVASYAGEVILIATLSGNGQTGTVAFSINSNTGTVVLPGCNAVPLVAGVARCAVPASYQVQSPRQYLAVYSGDVFNAPASTDYSLVVDLNSAVLSMSAFPLAPLVVGRQTTLTALVKMRNPAGSVTFFENDAPIPGCTQVAVSILPNATDAATATCTVTPQGPAGGIPPFKATYFYPVGHVSGRAFQFALLFNILVAQGPPDYTDMWWAGPSENGWGMSVTQHGPIQFNVIFAYDNLGKSLWYVMPGGSFNAAGTVFTGQLYLPTSSPFSAYDKTKFAIGAPVGSATITYTSSGTATLAYTINGISATKSMQRQQFASETASANLRVNDLWWATSAEDGWGVNIAQQGRVLFPVWYTYDAAGKATFFTAQGGSWNGTVWSGSVFSHASSAWLGVAYNPSAFTATNVGTISLDFTDASNATMTTTVNGITQVRHIERQSY